MKISRAHIEIIGDCNLCCVYCYNSEFQQTKKNRLSKDKLIGFIKQINKCKPEMYTISGGEPLIRTDLEEILSYCEAPIVLFTNTTLLTKERVEKLLKIPNLQGFRLSLDGFSSHEKYRTPSKSNEILCWIKYLSKNTNKDVAIATMLSRDGIKELDNFYETIKLIRLKHWRIDIPFFSGRYRDKKNNYDQADFKDIVLAIKKLIIKYKNDKPGFELGVASIYKSDINYPKMYKFNPNFHPCEYNLSAVCLRPNGDLSFCPSLNFTFGNIRKENNFIGQIKNIREENDFYKIKISELSDCMKCRYINICGGGCRADAFYLTGNLKEKDVVNCSLLPLVEKHIIPILDKEEQAGFLSLINNEGHTPIGKKNIKEYLRRQ